VLPSATLGEPRLPAALTVAAAIALQLVLPTKLGIHPKYLIPALEITLLLALVLANPRRVNSRSRLLRAGGLALIALVILANAVSAELLISDLLHARGPVKSPQSLLGSAGAIYLTNIIAFGLLYWEFDRGGPVARAYADVEFPDFLFPQMANKNVAPAHWEPRIVDYLYLSLTNAAAFSPTDTMPLTRKAKAFMSVQSAVALITIGLAIARVANILH
jgi:hypothetical protein